MSISKTGSDRTLREAMQSDQYAGYAYSYPHKTSYAPLAEPVSLKEAWHDEKKDSLFLYVHLPFCEFRCGFCNLFTTVQPAEEFVAETLANIARQSSVVAAAIEPARISKMAFGGGTPTYLSASELEQLFGFLSQHWPIAWGQVPISFEGSPATVSQEKLEVLKRFRVSRISVGIQSFSPHDLKSLGRPQDSRDIIKAAHLIREADFPIFNLDLIYGNQGQTSESWRQTIDETLKIRPEEIYLYPLYVRELTGLGKTGRTAQGQRHEFYWEARERLLAAGYQQLSMRLFRLANVQEVTDYSCQEDGMIGLGPGARSYTRELHYSSEFAVGQQGVRKIIRAFNQRTNEQFGEADYGVHLPLPEQKRRYFIKSILHAEGLSLHDYQQCFATVASDDFATEIEQLCELNLMEVHDERICLTKDGIAWSDTIGPWLYSADVVAKMEAFELE